MSKPPSVISKMPILSKRRKNIEPSLVISKMKPNQPKHKEREREFYRIITIGAVILFLGILPALIIRKKKSKLTKKI